MEEHRSNLVAMIAEHGLRQAEILVNFGSIFIINHNEKGVLFGFWGFV